MQKEKWYWLNDYAREFLARGYLLPGQTAEQRVRVIAEKAETILKRQGFADKFEDYMSRGWISLASPVWSNFGNEKGLPISCFGSYIDDNMGSILFTQAEVGMMSKFGGGCSGYFGSLRGRGTEITGNGTSSGAVHFMQLFETLTDVISQGSVRRGFFTPYLPLEHPDINEFLEIGTEGNPIQKLTYGVTVSNAWMKSMIEGDTEKRDIWAKVLQRRTQQGYPYVLFTDNANDQAPDVYRDKGLKIRASNMCVAPETMILTKDGYLPIHVLAGQAVEVWNGEEWSLSQVEQTGSNESLMLVTTDSGHELWCTPDHKFYVSEHDQIIQLTAKELTAGTKVIRPTELPVITNGNMSLSNAYAQGFFAGDGTVAGDHKYIDLYHDKRHLLSEFPKADWLSNNEKVKRIRFRYPDLREKTFVPGSGSSLSTRLEWFAGLCDSDGTVNTGQIQIVSINKQFLIDTMLMLQTLGVNSKVKQVNEAHLRDLPDGCDGYKEYNCKAAYRLLLSRVGVNQLLKLGFNARRLKLEVNDVNRTAERFTTILSVEKSDRRDDTYCFNEPLRHMGMFNGMLTGQCSEIMLPSTSEWSFVCCLSSVNLRHYDEWKDTDLIETMVAFLDTVMQEFIDKIESWGVSRESEKQLAYTFMYRAFAFAKANRALGLGVLGWHSLLQEKQLGFECMEATALTDEIFSLIKERADQASIDLALEFGEPEVLHGYGRRNTTLLAIAPTTSSAFILGQVSQGIEPIWSNCYVKDVAKLKVTIKNPQLEALLETKGLNTKEIWDSIRNHDGSVQHLEVLTDQERVVFRTFSEIDQSELLAQAAVRQRYLDQGQSLNVMVDPTLSTRDLNTLHIQAWRTGVKSLYYQHSMNAAQQMVRRKLIEKNNK